MCFLQRTFLITLSVLCTASIYTFEGTRSRVKAGARLSHRAEAKPVKQLLARPLLACDEELPQQHPLGKYIADWPTAIEAARIVCQQGHMNEFVHNGSTISCVTVQHHTMRLRISWYHVESSHHVKITKKVRQENIEFSDHSKSFAANNIAIHSIGTFLNPAIAYGIQSISLKNNDLADFAEIQKKIIKVCPLLRELWLDHNSLDGIVEIAHEKLAAFSAIHNKFSLLGKIKLPASQFVDLSSNNIHFNNSPSAQVSDICRFNIDNNPDIRVSGIAYDNSANQVYLDFGNEQPIRCAALSTDTSAPINYDLTKKYAQEYYAHDDNTASDSPETDIMNIDSSLELDDMSFIDKM